MRPAIEACVESRAPLVPIGSFTTCTSSGWPSARMRSIGRSEPFACRRCSQMSATCRNAARSSPISTNAAWMPGSTRATRPMQMFPTRPRLAVRSTTISCTCPAPITATRVSCGVTLIRISSVIERSERLQQLRGLEERQADDAGMAAADLAHEHCGAALDGVGAGLVVALAARHVVADLLRRDLAKLHLRSRQRGFQALPLLQGHGREHLVPLSRKRRENFLGVVAIRRLAEDAAVQRYGGVGGEDRRARQSPLEHSSPARDGFFPRDPQHVITRGFARLHVLAQFGARVRSRAKHEQVKRDAELREQLPAPRAARREVDRAVEGRSHEANDYAIRVPAIACGTDAR